MEHPISIVILVKDEERCLQRCLDSVVGQGIGDVIVADTGSVDRSMAIAERYRRHGVTLVQLPWCDSFAAARNSAIEVVGTGWVVFLDADEWLADGGARRLVAALASAAGRPDLDRLVLAPTIHHVERGQISDDVPRVFVADSGIRYRGAVHEYPVPPGAPEQPVDLAALDVTFHHDGYDHAVAAGKDKRSRNLALLHAALAEEPDNPRWWYFLVRDGLPTLDKAQLVEACGRLGTLARSTPATGDRRSARDYYRMSLCEASQGFAAMGDWPALLRNCDELERVDRHDSPDAHYLRSVACLFVGVPTDQDLLRTIALRRDDELVSTSAIDSSGRHLDALIAALLDRLRGAAAAERYLELCPPWTDAFFRRSRIRLAQAGRADQQPR